MDGVDSAFDTAFDDWIEAFIFGDATFDPDDYEVNVSSPAIQLQANFFTGDSGSNTFGGLRAGREYLVVVTAGSFAGSGLGFTTTTIKAGETKSVNLELKAENYARFGGFLLNRYGIERPATIVISADGYNNTQLYYDLLVGEAAPPPP